MIRKSYLACLIFSLSTSNLHAQSLVFGSLFSFAETNREIVTNLEEIRPLARPNFRLSTREADQMRALADLDQEIEGYAYTESYGDCDEEEEERSALREAIEGRRVRLLFAMTFSDQETSDNLHHRLHRETYAGFITEQQLTGSGLVPSRNLVVLKNDFEQTTGQSLAAMSLSEQSQAFNNLLVINTISMFQETF
jgi:hypothetical protein